MANWKEFVLGIVLFAVFWAFQAGYANSLGASAWFAGSIIFVILLWAIGYSLMPKVSAEAKQFWTFVSAFAIVATFIVSYMGPSLGAVLPANPAALTPLVLSFWLVVFGAAMFVDGHGTKNKVQTWLGVFWLFSALHFVTSVGTGANSYLHFALVVGLPHIIDGLVRKK
jgi:hypothetical protein